VIAWNRLTRATRWGLTLFAALLIIDGLGAGPGGLLVGEAQARVGRPATPVSVAGVARRTRRRTIRRTTVYVATLPTSCQTINIDGTVLSQCGGTYYQQSGTQYVVVNVE
jgi:hypothetical protein